MDVKLHIPAAAAEEHESPIAALMALTARVVMRAVMSVVMRGCDECCDE